MTEKDTKAEEVADEEFYDDYNENDNYYIDKALGNIKDDPGSVRSRPRRIPVYKIQLSDEDKIPKMPENILPEPKDAEFQKRIDELKQKNDEKKKSIEEQIEKRKQERMGVRSDDKGNVFQQKKDVNAKIKELTDLINNHEASISTIRAKFTMLSNKVKAYDKYKLPHNPKKLAQDIKKIKEKISFSAININEEQELINRKNLLEEFMKPLKEFLDFKKENEKVMNEMKEPKQQRKALYEKREKINKEIEALINKKETKKPEIDRINKIIESLKEDKKKINEEIRAVYAEWDKAWYDYNEQQYLINYIKEAQAKIKNLQRKQKRKEKEEKQAEKRDNPDKDKTLQIITYKPNEKELKLKQYNDLKDYFKALLPKEQQEKIEQQTSKSNYDISKEIQAGKLKKVEKKIDQDFGGETGGRKGKKGKKPKEPKDSRKANKKVGLTLDFDMIQKISEAGLTAPTKIDDIPQFLKELEEHEQKIRSGEIVEPSSKKEEPKKSEPIKEEPKKEEPKKEEPKKEEPKIEEPKKEEPKKEEPKKEEHKKEEHKKGPKKESKKEGKKEPRKESKKEPKKDQKKEQKKDESKEMKKEEKLPTLSQTLTTENAKIPVETKKEEKKVVEKKKEVKPKAQPIAPKKVVQGTVKKEEEEENEDEAEEEEEEEEDDEEEYKNKTTKVTTKTSTKPGATTTTTTKTTVTTSKITKKVEQQTVKKEEEDDDDEGEEEEEDEKK